jgi:tetratricopeptide (TPR) repeat protein
MTHKFSANLKTAIIFITSALICLSAVTIYAASEDIEKVFSSSKAFPLYEKGNDYLKNGQCDLAIGEYNKAVELAPDYYGLYNKLGYANYYSGRFEEALNYFRRALILKRDNLDTIIGIANAYMVLEQEREARHYFEKAIEIDPENSAAFMPLAFIYNHEKKFDESAKFAKKVLNNYPRYDAAYFLLAQDFELLKEFDPAIENYRKAIELTPGYARAYLGMARCYTSKAKYNTAYNYAKMALKHHADIKEVDDMMRSLKSRLRADRRARQAKKAAGKNI